MGFCSVCDLKHAAHAVLTMVQSLTPCKPHCGKRAPSHAVQCAPLCSVHR